jgi:hypothetical protein
VPRGVGVLYAELRMRSVIMGNGREFCGRAGGGRRKGERGWAAPVGVGGGRAALWNWGGLGLGRIL